MSEFKYDVFLSHNHNDKLRVRRLAERLREADLRVWFDEWIIKPGDDIFLAIEHGLEASRTLILCLSPAALASDWVDLERSTVLFRDPVNAGRRFIPVLLADCVIPDSLRRHQYVDYQRESDTTFRRLLEACVQSAPLSGQEGAGTGTKPPLEFDDKLLRRLEDMARTSVVIGGVAVMRYYRSSLSAFKKGGGVNPTIEADASATVQMIQYLTAEMRKISPGFVIWGEELSEKQSKDSSLTHRILSALSDRDNIVYTSREFVEKQKGRICVLVDALDGTRNFESGMPLFCSTVAVFVDGKPKIGAVYDPIHHTVLYGNLGYRTSPFAREWTVASGQESALAPNPQDLTLAVHLPSDNEDARKITIGVCRCLAGTGGGGAHAKRIYMLNSGLMALGMVARGQIAAFCNPATKWWDVAAGEVLVRAVRGHVTDFQGVDIDYGASSPIQVLAAVSPDHHRAVLDAIKTGADG